MSKREEQLAWIGWSKACDGLLNQTRIENMLGEATPDINGCNRHGTGFWIELKALTDWPARSTTCPLKGHFEKGQLTFLRNKLSWKQAAFVLLRVRGKEWYLLDPTKELEQLNKEGIIAASFAIGKDKCISYLESI